jgi:hypothetical protein
MSEHGGDWGAAFRGTAVSILDRGQVQNTDELARQHHNPQRCRYVHINNASPTLEATQTLTRHTNEVY